MTWIDFTDKKSIFLTLFKIIVKYYDILSSFDEEINDKSCTHYSFPFFVLKVDRKASKGRKIRYTRHPKLENFMFPVVRALASSAFRSDDDKSSSKFIKDVGDGVQNSFFRSLFQ